MKRLCLLLAALMAMIALPAPAMGDTAHETQVSGNFYYVLQDDGTAEITYWAGGAVSLEVPATLDGRAVTAIGDHALSYWDELERVVLPEGLVRLGSGAFEGCGALRAIALPNSLATLGYNPFLACESLERIDLPAGNDRLSFEDGLLLVPGEARLVCGLGAAQRRAVPEGTRIIGEYAFGGLAELKAVDLPQGLEEIREGAFQECAGLEAVALPDSVTHLGECAFAHCYGLRSATLSKGLREIAAEAFEGCERLEAIEVPEGVAAIGDFAFDGCENLADVRLPESLEAIGDAAFGRCSALRTIALPGAAAQLGANPFEDCAQLVEIAVPEDCEALAVEDGVLFADGGDRLVCYPMALPGETYAIPDGTECIGEYAFYCCNNLVSVRVPESVTAIGDSAFEGYENLTLTVERNSHAEAFARENGMKYTYPGADAWLNDD